MKKNILIALISLMFGIIFALVFYKQPNMRQGQKTVQTPTPIERQADLKIISSIPYWDQKNAFISLKNNVKKHDYLNVFWYFIAEDGEVASYEHAEEDKEIIATAHDNDVKVLATITNLPEDDDWDSTRVERMLRTRASRQEHIENIVQKLNELNFDGVNIDYEQVRPAEKNRFTAFMNELSDTLQRENKILGVALHAKVVGDEGLGGYQDWGELSKTADQLTIMAFNEHYDGGKPGPVASIPWIEKILAYARSVGVPSQKIYLGVPFFGYDWNKDSDEKAVGLEYRDVVRLLTDNDTTGQWDYGNKSPYFTYEKNGDEHEVWYENARSMREKIELAEEKGLAGVSFWRLGGEDPKTWEEL